MKKEMKEVLGFYFTKRKNNGNGGGVGMMDGEQWRIMVHDDIAYRDGEE